jgi:hypothetical protein
LTLLTAHAHQLHSPAQLKALPQAKSAQLELKLYERKLLVQIQDGYAMNVGAITTAHSQRTRNARIVESTIKPHGTLNPSGGLMHFIIFPIGPLVLNLVIITSAVVLSLSASHKVRYAQEKSASRTKKITRSCTPAPWSERKVEQN